jgi:hypothetical protein
MTKKLTLLLIFIISFNLVQASVDLSGYLQTDDRVRIKDWTVPWQEYRLALNINYSPTDKIHFYSEAWLRSFGFSNVSRSSDLIDKEKVAPWDLDFREAYIDLYGFLFSNLDLRIGRQRIAWGTADKLNPTDNLNPNDYEDIWDFGRHIGSNSIKATYYIKDLSITGIFIPTFTPAVLPRGDWLAALMPTLILPTYFTYQNITDTIIMPSNKLRESSSWGAKISKNLFGYDLSLSYVKGRYDLPMLSKLIFTPAETSGAVNLVSQLVYPKMQVVGADMAGAIKSVGVWAEVAMFIPEKTLLTTDMSAFGLGVFDTIALNNTPYFRYIIGLDYTFKNGIYINAQYLRGFTYERGKDNLEDYFLIGLDYKLLEDKLKLSPINSAIEIKKWDNFKNNYAFVLAPEISYSPVDGAEIILGFRWIDGKSTTTFGRVKANDEISLKVKYNF